MGVHVSFPILCVWTPINNADAGRFFLSFYLPGLLIHSVKISGQASEKERKESASA